MNTKAIKNMSSATTSISRLFTFVGGTTGSWIVNQVHCVAGEPILSPPRVSVISGEIEHLPPESMWALRGITSNERYVVREEKIVLASSRKVWVAPPQNMQRSFPFAKMLLGGHLLRTSGAKSLKLSPITLQLA
jgi:hypothetical protein